jgi:hypothetical protein
MAEAGLAMACRAERDWDAALERFSTDSDARAQAGRAGRAYVERRHAVEPLLSAWDAVFASLGRNG